MAIAPFISTEAGQYTAHSAATKPFDAIIAAIRAIHQEFLRRYEVGADQGDDLTVFIDELPALAAELRDRDIKDVLPMVVKWLRESRKVGIRVVILAQGWEVKTLGQERLDILAMKGRGDNRPGRRARGCWQRPTRCSRACGGSISMAWCRQYTCSRRRTAGTGPLRRRVLRRHPSRRRNQERGGKTPSALPGA